MRQSSPARQLLFKEYEDHNNNNIANQIIASHHNNNNTNSAYDSLSPQEKKTLRETTSLFICCRNLFSIQQIRFLGHLTQLTVLNLHMNNIKKIPPMVLSHLTHLEELDLSANEIGTLHKDSFSGLTKLKVLNLSSNCLVHLNPEEEEQEAEKGNGNKRKHKSKNSPLSNKTEWIKDGIFAPLESLQILYLSFNHVENLDGLRSILPPTGGGNNEKQHKSYFKKIDLSGNAIASLAQVKESLVLQRGNLEDIRLAIHHPNDKKEEEEDLQQAWMDQLTRENPFISQNSINTNNNMYVEELLEYFPSLQVIDGQSHGVNPIEEENSRKVEALATINSATGTTIKETQKKEEEEEKKKLLDEMNYYYTLKSDVEELKDQLTHIKEIEINRSNPKREKEAQPGRPSPAVKPLDVQPLVEHPNPATNPPHNNTVISEDDLDIPVLSPPKPFLSLPKGNATVTRSASGKLHILPRHSWTTTSPLAASQKSPVDSSPGSSPDADAADTAEATPERGEQWRLKQVSRGTSTDPQKEEEGHQLEERLAAQEMRLQRLQEQIAVRAVIQPQQDWQREKEAYRLEHELYKEKSSRERQTLRSQVSALKDELLRQRQEQTLLREKHQREMEAALRTQQGKTSQDEQLLRARHAKELEQTRETLRHQHELDLERETTAFQVFCKEQEEYFHSRLQQQAEETQLAVERQQERVRREQFVQLDALYTVVLQETERRRQLEGTESADRQALFHTVHHHQLVARLSRQVRRLETEKESILANFSVQNKTWEKYCNDLQEEYNDALRHAEEEVSRLLVGMEHLKKEDTPRSSAAHGRDVACDPIGQKEVHYETALSIVQEPSALPVEETATVYASPTDAYWKKVCARLQSEVESLQAAERVHLSSQATLTQENTRLLAQLHTLQSEQTSRQQAEQEKENLLRTLHSLKDDLQHKDDALDQLEEEAREKLEEKRCRIALLEEELALQREEREKSVAQSVAYKEEVEQTKKQLAELEEKFKVVWWQCCGSGQADEGEPMMSPPLSWQDSTPNATLLSTLPLHKKINEKDKLLQSLRLERQELVQGLTVARDQLLRSAAIEEQLQRRVGEMEQSVQQLKEEKRKWEEKCNVLEESYKQKQKQTWQTFVQIMGEAAP